MAPQEQAQSAAFSKDGQIIIVGCVSGKWLVMGSETREIYSTHVDGNEPIQVRRAHELSTDVLLKRGLVSPNNCTLYACGLYRVCMFKVVKFSPDGQLLALGSRDNYIYIYQVTDGAKKYTRLGRCSVSRLPINPVFITP